MSYQCCDTDLDPRSRLPPKFNHLFIDNLPWKFHASRFEIFCAKLLRGRLTDKQTTTKTYPPWLGGCSYHLRFLFNQYSFPKLMQVRPVPWSKPLQFLVYILQAWYLPVSHPTNCSKALKGHSTNHHHTTPPPQPFYGPFSGTTPGEPVPEENFWTLWCKGRLTEADTPTIRLGATPSGLAGAHLHHPPPYFSQAGCPSCRPTNSVKALKATTALTSTRKNHPLVSAFLEPQTDCWEKGTLLHLVWP